MLEKLNLFRVSRGLILIIALFGVVQSNAQPILPDTVRSCLADSVLVIGYPVYDSVFWDNGQTGGSAWYDEAGTYSVTWYKYGLENQQDFTLVIIPAQITETEFTIDCGDTVTLYGSDYSYQYLWEPYGVQGDSVDVFPRDTTNIYAVISNPDTAGLYCIDSASFVVNPVIVVDTVRQNITGCPGDSVAQIKIEASGGFPPYSYVWPPEATPLIEDSSYAIGLVDGDKVIKITDTIGCYINHAFKVKAHRLPELELFTDPTDTVYLQNPWVTFSYENPLYDSIPVDTFLVDNQWWDFGDSTSLSYNANPTYAYKKVGPKSIVLTFKTYLGCIGTDTIEIEVLPVELVASAAVTPNGDEMNDYFELFEDTGSGGGNENPPYKSGAEEPIDLSKYYLSNKLSIFNRWGEIVYKVDNYENDWDGEGLVDGAYFYVIECYGEYRTDVFKGTFLILGSGKSTE